MRIETTLEQMRGEVERERPKWDISTDWENAIGEACGNGNYGGGGDLSVVMGCEVSAAPFTLDDATEVLASVEGGHDEAPWMALFRLKDGRLAFINAWCDYTGWD